MINKPTFDADLLIQTIIGKYNEIKENTIFECMQIADSRTLSELRDKGYDLKITSEGIKTTVSLSLNDAHVITYTIYFDSENHKITRERFINNIESEDELDAF